MSTSVTQTSDAVEIARLVATTATALAWPLVVLIIALVFRRYIAQIIGRATGIQWGDFKVDFERDLENAEQRAETIETPPADEKNQPEPSLTTLPPDYLILDAWRHIDDELKGLAERAGISIRPGRSVLYITRVLRSTNILDTETSSLIDDLRTLRNVAVHKPPEVQPITLEQALRFRNLADLVLARLRQLPGPQAAVVGPA